MKIASKKAIPNSSVARAEVHCFLCQPCAIPLFVLLMLLVPAVPDAGRRPAHPGKTRCVHAALPENITDAGRRPAHPGKTRCIQAALPENITDAGRRPAHPGKTRCIQAALPENITDAGRRPVPPRKTRCIQAALPENITDAGWRPAHPGRPRGRKMVTGEPDRNLTSPNPPPIRRDSGQDSDCRL